MQMPGSMSLQILTRQARAMTAASTWSAKDEANLQKGKDGSHSDRRTDTQGDLRTDHPQPAHRKHYLVICQVSMPGEAAEEEEGPSAGQCSKQPLLWPSLNVMPCALTDMQPASMTPPKLLTFSRFTSPTLATNSAVGASRPDTCS